MKKRKKQQHTHTHTHEDMTKMVNEIHHKKKEKKCFQLETSFTIMKENESMKVSRCRCTIAISIISTLSSIRRWRWACGRCWNSCRRLITIWHRELQKDNIFNYQQSKTKTKYRFTDIEQALGFYLLDIVFQQYLLKVIFLHGYLSLGFYDETSSSMFVKTKIQSINSFLYWTLGRSMSSATRQIVLTNVTIRQDFLLLFLGLVIRIESWACEQSHLQQTAIFNHTYHEDHRSIVVFTFSIYRLGTSDVICGWSSYSMLETIIRWRNSAKKRKPENKKNSV